MLAELVKAGKLPPVEQRVAAGPARRQAGPRDRQVRRDLAARASPAPATTGTASARGSPARTHPVLGLHRREDRPEHRQGLRGPGRRQGDSCSRCGAGMKWSDGEPFTADDFVFWFEDIYCNKDLIPVRPPADVTINGKPGKIEKVRRRRPSSSSSRSRTTCSPTCWPAPPSLGATAFQGERRRRHRSRPAHYLKQFLPKYAGQDKVDEMAKAAGFDNWVSFFKVKNDWHSNPELPVVTPWKSVSRSTRRSGASSGTRTASGWTPTATSFRTSTRSS